MVPARELIYQYDGSYEGLLCCVFESYVNHEVPLDILPPERTQLTLEPMRQVPTVAEQARRVRVSLPKKMGHDATFLVERVFLSCHPKKEMMIYRFIRLGYCLGPNVMRHLGDERVSAMTKASLQLAAEANRYRGFVRFSDCGGFLWAVIAPKGRVLPLIRPHFCDRYAEDLFLIYDKAHKEALIYRPFESVIVPLEDFSPPEAGADERAWRAMWKCFYDTVAIPERYNPQQRMTQMPKRFWSELTELQEQPGGAIPLPESDAGSPMPGAPDGRSGPETPPGSDRNLPE